MGISIPHALSRSQRVFTMCETTFGTYVEPVASSSDEVRVLSTSMENSTERMVRMDSRSTRSHLERYTGKTANTWEITAYVMGSGDPGDVRVDAHNLLLAAVSGSDGFTATAGTRDTYAADQAGQTALKCLSICRHFPDLSNSTGIVQEQLSGCWVNEMTITAGVGEAPTWTFSGGAKNHVLTGRSTLQSNEAASATITVQTDDSYNFEIGSIINLGSDLTTNGYKVTAVDHSTNIVTLVNVSDDAAASVTVSTDSTIYPFVPTGITQGSPISGNLGSLDLSTATSTAGYANSGDLPITAFDLTLNNNMKALDDEAFQEEASSFIVGWREITGNVTFRVRRDLVNILGARKQFVAHDLVVTIGSVAGSTLIIELDVELDFSAMDAPEIGDAGDDEVTVQVPFMCIADDGAESEFVMKFE